MSTSDRQYRAEFYRAVDQRQASDPRQREYYVPIYEQAELRPHDTVRTLQDGIEFTAGQSVQILSGFRGSGKTSELLRLQTALQREGYSVVYLDVEDYFNTDLPIEFGGFVLGLAAGFAEACADPAAGNIVDSTPWQRFTGLLGRLNIETTMTAGPLELKASLRDDAAFRSQVAKVVQSNRRQFRAELHAFFAQAATTVTSQVGTVFIVDSIDHFRGRTERFQDVRESVEAVFNEGAEDLELPGMHVIYTVPVYVATGLGIRRDVLNIKVADQQGKPFGPGLDALRRVLAKRAPGGDLDRLLSAAGVEQLILASGGLIRDLLRLTGEVVRAADALPADLGAVSRAESAVRSDMQMTLSLEQLEILRRVAERHQLTPAKAEWSDAADLMSKGALLRYPNGSIPWYGVHPLLAPLLDA
jgi:hypothetical protein